MPKTQRKNKTGKTQNKSTSNSTSPLPVKGEGFLNQTEATQEHSEISPETTQDTDIRRTILDILKEIKEYKEQIKEIKEYKEQIKEREWQTQELEGKNDKLRKDLEGENDKLWKKVETQKRYQPEMKKETDQRSKELQEKNDKL